MPDSPAENNFAALKKMVLDPGTERMATKEELISLLEAAAEPEVSPRISGTGAIATSTKSEVAKNQSAKIEVAENNSAKKESAKSENLKKESVKEVAKNPASAASEHARTDATLESEAIAAKKKSNVLADLENLASRASARPVPIPETSAPETGTNVDLVELAAILDQHRIWVESGGDEGTKADLSGVNLENADLTGVNLQGAILQRANLRNADLSMANLRGASLVQADLCNANLLGAELRGADLMCATVHAAEGLWLGRLG